MQHVSEFPTPSTISCASEGSTPAAKSKRSLRLHSPAERPRQDVFMQKKSEPLTPKANEDAPCGASAASPASQGAAETGCTTASTTAHGGGAMSWLPFPAMNADAPWADLADSDDDDMGWSLRPVSGEEASPVQDPLHNDGTIPVTGPLIPSFSGEDVMGAAKGGTAVGGGAQSDLSTASFGRLESPTPVAIIQDLTSQPSRTQFGFALGSALSSKAALGGADGFLGATASDVAGSHAQWAKLQNRSKDSVPEFAVEPRLEAVHPVNSDERVTNMVEEAKEGFAAGCRPNAPREGMGGTYFLSDASGSHVGIFKPCDEEPLAPNNPKGWNSRSMSDPGMKPSVRVGEAALREVAAFLLDHDGFAGVPAACLVAVSHQSLNYAAQPESNSAAPCEAPSTSPIAASPPLGGESEATTSSEVSSHSPVATPADSRLTAPAVPGGVKLGSLQAFAEHTCDANDIASSRFSADSIHRVGILDVRLLNLDRHAGNLLVAEAPRGGSGAGGPAPLHKLVPIDHGFALPEALDDPYFEWQYWPQASVPFSAEVKAYVEALDGPADVAMLQRELPALRPECLRCLLVTTTVLKKCVAANMTLSEIAGIFTRAKASEASDFEAICMDAREDAMAALPTRPSLTFSDFTAMARDNTSGHPSTGLGGFPFDEDSGQLSPQSSLAMSGLIGNGIASLTVSCDTSPFKRVSDKLVSEVPVESDAQAPESPCMLASAAVAAIECCTPTAGNALPAVPAASSWLCTAQCLYSPQSPTLVSSTNACFNPPTFAGAGFRLGDPAAADVRRSEQGMSMGGLDCHFSARTAVPSRTVWHSKRRGRNGANHPNLLSAVHPDKANYVFSGLSESQWSVFLGRVEDFVNEELCKGTWNAPCSGPVAGSCPEPVKTRKF